MATKKIEDDGVKIGGARKDLVGTSFSKEVYDNLTLEERITLVTKDKIWPKPNFTKLVAEGLSVDVAAEIKVLRDAIAAKPNTKHARANEIPNIFDGYHELVSDIRDLAMAAKRIEDVRGIFSVITEKYRVLRKHNPDQPTVDRWFSIYKNRMCPIQMSAKQIRTARDLVDSNFPENSVVLTKHILISKNADQTFSSLYKFQRVPGSYPTRDDATAAAVEFASALKNKSKTASYRPIKPERPHLDFLERKNPVDYRNGKDVSTAKFLEQFGYRGIEFGNWVPQDERQTMLNSAYDGLMDLANVLGWEPGSLSLGGTLSAAFGARGKGRAAATYEPGRRVFNFTRFKGAGCLAHEFGHALDHAIGTGSALLTSCVPFATGPGSVSYPSNVMDYLKHRDDEIRKAWSSAIGSLFITDLPRVDCIKQTEAEIVDIAAKLDAYKVQIACASSSDKERLDYEQRDLRHQLATKRAILERLEKSTLPTVTEYTKYYREAVRISGPDGYEANSAEMFARAFEAWVHDRLAEQNCQNDYLVLGASGDDFCSLLYAGNPYPTGAERESFNANFDMLARATYEFAHSNLPPKKTPQKTLVEASNGAPTEAPVSAPPEYTATGGQFGFGF